VKLQRIELRHGHSILFKYPRSIILGKTAPKQGLPELLWGDNVDQWAIPFPAKD